MRQNHSNLISQQIHRFSFDPPTDSKVWETMQQKIIDFIDARWLSANSRTSACNLRIGTKCIFSLKIQNA